jgi:malate dehydrogenase
MKDKIAIIGAGQVGAEVANELMRKDVGDCILVDVRNPLAHGKSLDLMHSAPLRRSSVRIAGFGEYSAIRDCNVVVIAAGAPRKPGMSREDLLQVNLQVIKEISRECAKYAPEAIWVIVTNPLDAMAYAAWKLTDKDPRTILGMAGSLDSARFASLLARACGVSAEDVQAIVLGSHGDLMIPLIRFATVAGIPASHLLQEKEIDSVIDQTRNAGSELVSLLQSGSAYYAAGSAIAGMVDAVMRDKRKVLCASVLCKGEYGLNGIFIGLPLVVCSRGVHRIIELRLNDPEWRELKKTTEHLQSMQSAVDRLLASG